jgi:hypothetical protein
MHLSNLPKKVILFCGLLLAARSCFAQPDFTRDGTPVTAAPPDPAIARALADIDPARIKKTIETLVAFGTRNTSTSIENDLPAGTGIQAAADWIYGQLEQISKDCGGCLEVKRDEFIADPASTGGASWGRRIQKPTKLTNVYAILRGTDAERSKALYLVTGHYDSINSNVFKNWADTSGDAPGANDDASGTAVSLECARVLSKLHFPGSLVFVAVAGEEQGLVGSAHLAHLAKQEGWQLEAVLNNDIVGGNTTPGETLQMKDRVRVFSEGVPSAATPEQVRRILALGQENDSPSRELARTVADVARTYTKGEGTAAFHPVMEFRPDRYLRGGDHTSFNHEGFAAVRFTEWREDFNHQHQNVVRSASPVLGDLLEFVDFAYVANVARTNAATLATLAAAPGKPQQVEIDAKKLENGTTLRWNAAPGKVDHYEIVWRETSAPDWQYVKQAPASQAGQPLTLPISKDNVFFGVRAVDAAGHRSLIAVP